MQQNSALPITIGSLYHTQSETSPNTTQPKHPLSVFCSINWRCSVCECNFSSTGIYSIFESQCQYFGGKGERGPRYIKKLIIDKVQQYATSEPGSLSNQKSAYRENYSDFIFHTWFGFHVHSDVEFVNVSHEQEF